MVASDRSPLARLVEVDETEMVFRNKNDPLTGGGGRSHQGEIAPVVGAVEVADGGAGPGRIRLQQVSDYSANSLHPFLKANLAPGATARTDGWAGYPGAPGVAPSLMSSAAWPPIWCCPGPTACSPTSSAGRSAFTHGLRRKHLQTYLDEFVFRFNRRRARHAAFRSLLGIAAAHSPLSYKM